MSVEEMPNRTRCTHCDSIIRRCPSQLNEGKNFCDKECFAEYRKQNSDGPANYTDGWYSQRKAALKRDSFQCVVCGMGREAHREKYGRDLDVHHKKPVREFSAQSTAHKLENLETLCREHHAEREEGGWGWRGFISD